MKVIADLDKKGLVGKSPRRRFKGDLDVRKWRQNTDSFLRIHSRGKQKNGTLVV